MSPEKQKILVGTTLEPTSDPVVRAGAVLAKRAHAELHLFHAHALPMAFFAGPSGMTTISPDILETEQTVRRQMADKQLERVGLDTDDVTSLTIRAGAPHRMLLESGARLGADLIVIGASEHPDHPLHGSTTDRVLRKATCPVWVIGGEHPRPPKRVVAPVDLSSLSEECLGRGLDLLTELSNGSGPPNAEALFVLTREERDSSTQFTAEQIERMANEELERFVERLTSDESRQLDRRVRVGEIRREILQEIAERDADLLVLGTHGRSGFERFLLGSVATDMAGRAPCDVLIIPPRQAANHD